MQTTYALARTGIEERLSATHNDDGRRADLALALPRGTRMEFREGARSRAPRLEAGYRERSFSNSSFEIS
jgi:hypothetical protein